MTDELQTSSNKGYFIALASALVLSTTGIFIRYLTQTYQLPPLILALWREVFVCLTLLIVLRVWRPDLLKIDRHHLPYLFWYGLVLAAFNALWTTSVALAGAAIATVLAYTSAGFSAILGRWLLKEPLTTAKIAALVFNLSGILLVSGMLDENLSAANLAGVITGALSGLAYAGYTLMGRVAAQRGLNSWSTLMYIFGIAAVIMLGLNLLPGDIVPGSAKEIGEIFWLGDSWAGWGVLLLLAAVPTVGGYGLYNLSLVYLPSSIVSLLVTTEPPFTAAIAYLFLGERLTPWQIAGSVLILAGVIFLRLGRKNGKSPALH